MSVHQAPSIPSCRSSASSRRRTNRSASWPTTRCTITGREGVSQPIITVSFPATWKRSLVGGWWASCPREPAAICTGWIMGNHARVVIASSTPRPWGSWLSMPGAVSNIARTPRWPCPSCCYPWDAVFPPPNVSSGPALSMSAVGRGVPGTSPRSTLSRRSGFMKIPAASWSCRRSASESSASVPCPTRCMESLVLSSKRRAPWP